MNKNKSSLFIMIVIIFSFLMFQTLITEAAIEAIRIEGENDSAITANFTRQKTGYPMDSYMSGSDQMYLHSAVLPTGSDAFLITYSFNVITAGKYNLSITSTFPGNSYGSAYQFKVNNGDFALVTASNAKDYGSIGGAFAANLHNLQILSTFDLPVGQNTIIFKINTFRTSDNARYDFFLDYFEFDKIGIRADLDKKVIDFGQTARVVGLNGVLPLKRNNDFTGATYNYTTANPSVATVDAQTGNIMAIGGGNTNIKLTVSSGSVSEEVDLPITVTMNNIEVSQITFENESGQPLTNYIGGGLIKANTIITNHSTTPSDVTFILILRDENNFVKQIVANKMNVGANELKPMTAQFSNLPLGNYTVNAFVLDDLTGMLPLTGITILK